MGDYQDGDRIYATHWLSMKRAIAGDVIVTGIAVTETSPASMSVDVSAGHFYQNGTRQVIAGTNIAVSPSDTTNARLDLISGGPAGLVYTAGTPALLVAPPDLPAGHIAIAMIYVPANSTTVVQANIREFAFPSPFREHATQHEDGGDDIVTPAIHGSRHGYGIADELNVEDLATTEFTTDKFLQPGGAGNLVWGDVRKEIEIAIKEVYDYTGNVFNQAVVLHPWGSPSQLPAPAALAGPGQGCAWSPNGEFLAVAHSTSPSITVHQRSGTTFIQLPALATLPGDGHGCAWSPNGEFLAVAHDISPYITVYQRSGTTFTQLPALTALPGDGQDCVWSPNGEFLAVAHKGSPYITVYQRSGTTFTQLPAMTALPSTAYGCSWSPNGEFLAVAHVGSPHITVYQRSGTTFTQLPALTALTGGGQDCAWSPNGEFLAAAHDTSPYITVYQRSGTTFTQLPAMTALPNVGFGCSWSPNGEFLAAAHDTSPYITVYQRSGTTFTKLPAMTALALNGLGCAWSPNGEFLAVAHNGSPYITSYQTGLDLPETGTVIIKGVRREGT